MKPTEQSELYRDLTCRRHLAQARAAGNVPIEFTTRQLDQ
jgi:hypothetical protein